MDFVDLQKLKTRRSALRRQSVTNPATFPVTSPNPQSMHALTHLPIRSNSRPASQSSICAHSPLHNFSSNISPPKSSIIQPARSVPVTAVDLLRYFSAQKQNVYMPHWQITLFSQTFSQRTKCHKAVEELHTRKKNNKCEMFERKEEWEGGML